ncbi:MAG: 2-oxoacid:ferredoxin oxidoreductase subunit beta [Myxococcales bacterium]|nr:2-oxoacid:ferredoxin oxidoreductase subunit beta [Myxococcota bacterium]MDW8282352.1 2-oxoacid:ferredoxin oxidoreductase subunit beta [Myxococcales bacterium]
MTYLPKPKVHHPDLPRNALGLTRRDYEGSLSTLCAGCGHDSVTAALILAFFELDIPPHRVAKLSGIGCSSKTPTYFLREAHGFNGVHGRMPALATGVSAARRDLWLVGISGDGDSLSIGLGQFCHAIRRRVRMVYILENNGVYGLTKGQFSASADIGSKSKKGEPNQQAPIDPVLLALSLGATFVARGFSGDKEQLVPILKAAFRHHGFAFVDVISPCVTFNDHEGSTKSYQYTRDHYKPVVHADFVPTHQEIVAHSEEGGVLDIRLHDGSVLRLRRTERDYDPTSRDAAYAYVRRHQDQGEVVTGILYIDSSPSEMHALSGTVETPLAQIPYEQLCPGGAALDQLMDSFR